MSVFEKLAESYPQLYIKPEKNGREKYLSVVQKGEKIREKSLEHFHGTDRDALLIENTPAGEVQVLYLYDRRDFETFLQIMALRCELKEIPKSTGSMTIFGVPNRGKIDKHKEEYLAGGGECWMAEFVLFTLEKENYCDTIVVISDGPYSAVDASEVGMSEEEWIEVSRKIRLFHECSHVICRRKWPDDRDLVRDEVFADAVGLVGAMGDYDENLAGRFLGIKKEHYTGGRLANYLKSGEHPEELVEKVSEMIKNIAAERKANPSMEPYEFLIHIFNK